MVVVLVDFRFFHGVCELLASATTFTSTSTGT